MKTSTDLNTHICIRGAKEHNLKNVDLDLPRNELIVITGLSGSGKSSLAFDTIYAEGQRRYVESLSAYARQFLNIQDKPNVESITGLSPAIAIDQKTTSRNPRSTVGTVTEIYDYLRLLFARIGVPYSPVTGLPIESQTISQMADRIMELPEGTRLHLLAPIARGSKGTFVKEMMDLKKKGFQRVKVNGEMMEVDDVPSLDKNKKHNIEVVVDRIVVREDLGNRLSDSIETALGLSDGLLYAEIAKLPEGYLKEGQQADPALSAASGEMQEAFRGGKLNTNQQADPALSATSGEMQEAFRGGKLKEGEIITFSSKFACPESGFTLSEIEPRLFSFNSPFGACPTCDGLGSQLIIDPDLVVPDTKLSLRGGAIAPWASSTSKYYMQTLEGLSQHYGFSLDVPFKDLKDEHKEAILYGSGDEVIKIIYQDGFRNLTSRKPFEGVVNNLQRRLKETESNWSREELGKYQNNQPCPDCHGHRLKQEAMCVKVNGLHIGETTQFTIEEAAIWFENLNARLSKKHQTIAEKILQEIRMRLGFLVNVGLDYLTLSRESGTLSGGESQRIRLASQIGAGLTGVLYVLDEPSIGLHQCDNERLLNTLRNLRNIGNTVIVVEHDEDTMQAADYLVDMGPGAGVHGGQVVAAGTPDEVKRNANSITGQYLSGQKRIHVPAERRKVNAKKQITIHNARTNNLKNITVSVPLGVMSVVSGVSGGGKSSLIIETLYKAAMKRLHNSRENPGAHDKITGLEYIDKIIEIDQSPIGRTPRSNPATYTGAFGPIRDWFAGLPEAKARGYKPGRFSFNVKGGRCEACQGDGMIKIEMHFLPDVYVKCDICKGKRYNRETLEIKYKDKSIADVLEMTVAEAAEFFANVPTIHEKLAALNEVGLSYVQTGQSATTLSGGEAQRIKLARELSKRATGNTLYILDEPTTGLHTHDINKLLGVLQKLVNSGNSMVIIEHNLDVIKSADWVIDVGPGGGSKGGMVVAEGTPEDLARNDESVTGRFLKPLLEKDKHKAA